MRHDVFWLGKRGSRPGEYEDAHAEAPRSGRFALADGASESAFAALWAQILVGQFVARPPAELEPWAAWLPAAQEQWRREFQGRDLPYYTEAKLRQGTFATFLGLVLRAQQGPGVAWDAVAVGDSCLFQTQGDLLIRSFPIASPERFNNSPWLVGSDTPAPVLEEKRSLRASGEGAPGDRLWMMTDALAHWFLREDKAGGRPWRQMETILQEPSPERFAAWIEGLRTAERLRNDDVTLLAIQL